MNVLQVGLLLYRQVCKRPELYAIAVASGPRSQLFLPTAIFFQLRAKLTIYTLKERAKKLIQMIYCLFKKTQPVMRKVDKTIIIVAAKKSATTC